MSNTLASEQKFQSQNKKVTHPIGEKKKNGRARGRNKATGTNYTIALKRNVVETLKGGQTGTLLLVKGSGTFGERKKVGLSGQCLGEQGIRQRLIRLELGYRPWQGISVGKNSISGEVGGVPESGVEWARGSAREPLNRKKQQASD